MKKSVWYNFTGHWYALICKAGDAKIQFPELTIPAGRCSFSTICVKKWAYMEIYYSAYKKQSEPIDYSSKKAIFSIKIRLNKDFEHLVDNY